MQLWDKSLYVSDDYGGVCCVPSATQMLCTDQSQNKVLGVRVFLPYFSETLLYCSCLQRYVVRLCGTDKAVFKYSNLAKGWGCVRDKQRWLQDQDLTENWGLRESRKTGCVYCVLKQQK
jgi:hypothetical protein